MPAPHSPRTDPLLPSPSIRHRLWEESFLFCFPRFSSFLQQTAHTSHVIESKSNTAHSGLLLPVPLSQKQPLCQHPGASLWWCLEKPPLAFSPLLISFLQIFRKCLLWGHTESAEWFTCESDPQSTRRVCSLRPVSGVSVRSFESQMDVSGNPVPSFLTSVLEWPDNVSPGYLSKGIYPKAIYSLKIIHVAPKTLIFKVFWQGENRHHFLSLEQAVSEVFIWVTFCIERKPE